MFYLHIPSKPTIKILSDSVPRVQDRIDGDINGDQEYIVKKVVWIAEVTSEKPTSRRAWPHVYVREPHPRPPSPKCPACKSIFLAVKDGYVICGVCGCANPVEKEEDAKTYITVEKADELAQDLFDWDYRSEMGRHTTPPLKMSELGLLDDVKKDYMARLLGLLRKMNIGIRGYDKK